MSMESFLVMVPDEWMMLASSSFMMKLTVFYITTATLTLKYMKKKKIYKISQMINKKYRKFEYFYALLVIMANNKKVDNTIIIFS